MDRIFFKCSSLLSLPDISKWNINNVQNIDGIFGGCNSLISLPNISNWNTENLEKFFSILSECFSLLNLTDITKWKGYNEHNLNAPLDYEFINDFINMNDFLFDTSPPNEANFFGYDFSEQKKLDKIIKILGFRLNYE